MSVEGRMHIPPEQLEFTFVRSSGPGGQNVNKVSSKAQLRWNPGKSGLLSSEVLQRLETLFPSHFTKDGDLLITSQKTRDQLKNREDCLAKLQTMILKASTIPKPRKPTKRTKSSVRRRLEDKEKNAQKKEGRKSGNWE
ncbi:MAG: aminoacyl-tRNA hydrolase [Planctomycetaceae bacterium]|nr:aminoacyl-tRNA hydrolase [Planctomycetaceae bacterium]